MLFILKRIRPHSAHAAFSLDETPFSSLQYQLGKYKVSCNGYL